MSPVAEKIKQVLKGVLIGSLVGLSALCVFVAVLLYIQISNPAGDSKTTVRIDVHPGLTLTQFSALLAEKKLIRSPSAFRILAYLKQKESQIRIGEYDISPSMLPDEILESITSGKTVLRPVTIPEGYRITEIAALLEGQGLADPQKFIQWTRDKTLIQSLNIPSDSLEGYLYPETYHFSKYTSEQKIVQTMVDTFKAKTLDILKNATSLDFSIHEIITLASLIEKETGVDAERKQISSVFHNRLKKKMRLQTDPTVIYAISNFDGNIRKKDLSIDSPYNTYRYAGLPPGPIANPGLQSIIAAMNPIQSDHLYFVSRQDGSHQFSSNLVDHNRAVQKYQLQKQSERL